MNHPRKILRRPDAMAFCGITTISTWYLKIRDGVIPKGTKLDPNGKIVFWFEDELAAIIEAAAQRSKQEAA